MSVRLLCIGRIKDGPERTLIDDYLARARRIGQAHGWRSIEEIELPSGGGANAEGQRLFDRTRGRTILLDERGAAWNSGDMSRRLVNWRDAGEEVDFVIGGADGFAPEVRERGADMLSFGALTWPHRLVRVMLAEQIYRALSIAAGIPYHRE